MKRPSGDVWVSKTFGFSLKTLGIRHKWNLYGFPLLLNQVVATSRSKRLYQFHADYS